ncbi:heme lyase CcmF/NrfE family subunit [Wohlfahrtiimonas chitiniclastica]|uniref:heme lyase CcmF/NrfE family subunit n=1 Tax=Wohlfahrtiimonas chitiniclastica TaxID=400946 RepID=UPI001BCC8E8E|nr:heme lyase CcmF/NrfE family subunit [Wohlfahrtiimonas chitiniclastica]MBS7814316.1 heme lyase CcmF/NrfE family subunit [Wohlfahrtiimonas chitiniclastica]
MLPIGELTLYVALATALLLLFLPLIGLVTHNTKLMQTAKPLTLWLFVLLLTSFVSLGYAFYTNDFSYAYVFSNSNTQLPAIFRLTAIWGSHEGSMLLWVFTLSLWMFVAIFFMRKLPIELTATTLAILGAIIASFIAFVIFTSNPFERAINSIVFDGRDLNPLLQDVGLIIHPPLLYMGYVGFAIPYAFVCAILINGYIDRTTVRWLRPWVLAAWGFLTLGITVGSWWAYYELGWGGWWFWDPVENASLIPWILSTALLHSLITTEKRQVFSVWSVLMAILCFSLSVLGTFLVRSGVLTSVHSFAADPRRGAIILIILACVVIFGIALLLIRSSRIRQHNGVALFSRETGILLNNIFLSVVCFIVVLGTLYPLIVDMLQIGKISVGPNFFNKTVNPLAMILLVILGITPLVRYKKDQLSRIRKPLIIMAIAAVIMGPLSNAAYVLYVNGLLPEGHADRMPLINPMVTLSLILCYWVFFGILAEIAMHKPRNASFIKGFFTQSMSRVAMNLGHLGVVVTIVGITMTSYYSVEADRLLKVGQTEVVQGYEFKLENLENIKGPNYFATKGTFSVSYQGKFLRMMHPEKRIYAASGMPISEVALRASLFDDLYIALAEERPGQSWAIRLYVKPFIRWIWLGGVIISIAALLAMLALRRPERAEK